MAFKHGAVTVTENTNGNMLETIGMPINIGRANIVIGLKIRKKMPLIKQCTGH